VAEQLSSREGEEEPQEAWRGAWTRERRHRNGECRQRNGGTANRNEERRAVDPERVSLWQPAADSRCRRGCRETETETQIQIEIETKTEIEIEIETITETEIETDTGKVRGCVFHCQIVAFQWQCASTRGRAPRKGAGQDTKSKDEPETAASNKNIIGKSPEILTRKTC